MDAKYTELLALLRSLDGAVVAFSGGVDSTLLLQAAHEALGDRALAVTARSPTFARREHDEASELARRIGARHRFVDTHEIDDPRFRRNPPDRCYLCKRELFRLLQRIAVAESLAAVIEGSNLDDADDYRPGRRALAELGIVSPLVAVGLTKSEVREISRHLGLPTWDKPALACLASRIPYGEEITADRLARVDRAEEVVRALGIAQVRVRDHGAVARIEVAPAAITLLAAEDARRRLVAELQALGYRFVTLDLQGYRSGALNELLPTRTGANDRVQQLPRQSGE